MGVIDKKNFLGGLNQDTEQRLVPQGDYRDALNIRVGESEGDDVGAIENVRGSEFILNDFHPGVSTRNLTCIGTYEDQVFDRIIYLVADSSNSANPKHSIYEYNLKTNSIFLILRSRFLNFNKYHHVYGMNVIAHEEPFAPEGILYWTDDFNQPRKLNIARAKISSGTGFVSSGVYKSVEEYISFDEGSTYHVSVPNVINSLNLGYDFGSQFDFDIKINAIDQPPLTAPTFYLDTDPDFPQNNMWGKIFEFKYRYVYDTNEKSAFSPSSIITTAYNYAPGQNTDGNNFHKDNRAIISYNWGQEHVKEVEICARIIQQSEGEGFSTDIGWFVAETLERARTQSAYSSGTYNFYNDKPYKLIPPSETAKLFDDVPHKAKAQEIIDGNRLVYGNVVNGYDSLPHISIGLEEDFESEFLDENGEPLGGTFSFTQTDEIEVEVKTNYSKGATAPYGKSYYIELTFPNTPAMENIEIDLEVNKKFRGDFFASGYLTNVCGGCNNDEFVETEISFEWNRVYNLGPGSTGKTGAELAQDFYDDFLSNYDTVGDIMEATNSSYNVQFPCNTYGNAHQGGGVRWDSALENNGWGNETPSGSNWYNIHKSEHDMLVPSNLANYKAQDISDRIHVVGNKVYISRTWQNNPILNSDDGYGIIEMWLDYTTACIDHEVSWEVSSFGSNTNDIISYTLGTDQISQEQIFMSSFKTGANHKFGIVYYDEFNRSSSVQIPKNGSHNIYLKSYLERQIFGNNANGGVEIKWTLNHRPPDWAHHYQWVYAGNTTMSDFEIVGTLGVIDSASIFTSNSHPLKKTYLVDASEIYLNSKDKSKSTINWDYQEGDRVRFVLQEDASGNVGESFDNTISPGDAVDFKILGITGEGEYKDVFSPGEQDSAAAITGYMDALHADLNNLITDFESADDTGSSGETVTNKKPKITSKFLVLEKEEWLNANIPDGAGKDSSPALKGSYIEVYRPSKSTNDEDVIFYEFGELFPITLDANGNRVHGGLNNLNQSFDNVGQPLTPAQGVFRNGDTYLRIRLAHHNDVDGTFIESFHQSDYFKSDYWSKGRPNRYDNEVYQKRRKSTVYYSEPFMPDTNINGLSTFNSSGLVDLPYNEYNVSLGSIQKLFAQDNALIIFQEDKVSRSLVERNILYSADGSGQLTASNSILSAGIAYSGEYGIGTHPESFAEYGGRIYFYDLDRSAVLRLSQNGLTAISDNFMKDYFNDKSQDIKKNNRNIKIPGVYDVKKNEYILTFSGVTKLTEVDLCELASLGDWDSDVIYQIGDVVTYTVDNPYVFGTTPAQQWILYTNISSSGEEYDGQAPDGTWVNSQDGQIESLPGDFWILCSNDENSAGCSDPGAANYNPVALVDDGSCSFPCLGLVDDLETVIVGGSLVVSPESITYGFGYVLGNEDGSINLQLSGGTQPYYVFLIENSSGLIVWGDTNNNGVVSIPDISFGLYTLAFIPNDNFDTTEILEGLPGASIFGGEQATFADWIEAAQELGMPEFQQGLIEHVLNYVIQCGIMVEIDVPLSGCTDPNSFNYISDATLDDGACVSEVLGCPDPNALNYFCDLNPDLCQTYDVNNPGWLITDDGSCQYPIPGCTDPAADNYNPLADTEDGSCTFCNTFTLSIESVTNVTSFGGNDGTASVTASGGTPPYNINYPFTTNAISAGVYNVTATDSDGCTAEVVINITEPGPVLGCTDNQALNYLASAQEDDGSCVYCPAYMFNSSASNPTVIGGMGSISGNLYPQYFFDNGLGEQNVLITVTNVTTNTVVWSTTLTMGLSMNPASSFSTGSTLIPGTYTVDAVVQDTAISGCSESSTHVINDVNCNDSSTPNLFVNSGNVVIQNNDSISWNSFSPDSNTLNNNCCSKGKGSGCDGNGNFFIEVDTFGFGTPYGTVGDGMWDNSTMTLLDINDNIIATLDPQNNGFGSDVTLEIGATLTLDTSTPNKDTIHAEGLPVGTYRLIWYLYDESGAITCQESIHGIQISCIGCMDSGSSAANSPLYNAFGGDASLAQASNYNPNATSPGTCNYNIYACNDPESDTFGQTCEYIETDGVEGINFSAFNYLGTNLTIPNHPNVNVIEDDCSCLYLGCTDPNASNYDSTANQDDGSCQYLGCTDSGALNYDPSANISDGSCIYCDDGNGDIFVTYNLDYSALIGFNNASTNTLTINTQSNSVPYTVLCNAIGLNQIVNSTEAQTFTGSNLPSSEYNEIHVYASAGNPYIDCNLDYFDVFQVIDNLCPENQEQVSSMIGHNSNSGANKVVYQPEQGDANIPGTVAMFDIKYITNNIHANMLSSNFGITVQETFIMSVTGNISVYNGNLLDYDSSYFDNGTFGPDNPLGTAQTSLSLGQTKVMIPSHPLHGEFAPLGGDLHLGIKYLEPNGTETSCFVRLRFYNNCQHSWLRANDGHRITGTFGVVYELDGVQYPLYEVDGSTLSNANLIHMSDNVYKIKFNNNVADSQQTINLSV